MDGVKVAGVLTVLFLSHSKLGWRPVLDGKMKVPPFMNLCADTQ